MRFAVLARGYAVASGVCALACTHTVPPPARATSTAVPRAPTAQPSAEAPDQAVPQWIRSELGELKLPIAYHGIPLVPTINVVISRTRVVVEGELVAGVQELAAAGRVQRVDGLSTWLKRRRAGATASGALFSGEVTFWVDAQVPALVVKSAFQTAAFAGYPRASFVVRQHDAPARFARLPAQARVPRPLGGLGLKGVANLRAGEAPVSGGLPPEVIQQRIRASYSAFRRCYEGGLARDPKLSGRVQVRFVIGHAGQVSDVTDHGSTLPDPEVVACVVDRFKTLEFPAPKETIVTVVYPIQFAPE
jgi:hypothetical protein